jgi:uncharacterized protein YbjT (DUF2867 family)
MGKTILVTGASGKTGRRLVPLLQAQGAVVRAASRTPREGRVRFDWHEAGTHRDALAGVEAVYLVPPPLLENPVQAVAAFLGVAVDAGVRRVVLLSSMGAGFPGEPRTSGRRALEALVRECGLPWTILRPSGFMQNFSEGFLAGPVRNGAIPNPAGDGKVAMVDAGDVAAVAATVLAEGSMHANRVYDVTGPEPIGFVEAAARIASAAGHPVAAVPMDSSRFLAMLVDAGVPADYAAMLLRDQEAIRVGNAAAVADTVERIAGRVPTSFANYAAAAWGA